MDYLLCVTMFIIIIWGYIYYSKGGENDNH